MSLPLISTRSLDTPAAQMRVAESINDILTFRADDWRTRTAAEQAAGIYPINSAFPPGDVRRYGAVGDGVTDDTAAMNRAFSVASEIGGSIIRLTGTVLITSALTLPANTSLCGSGKRATKLLKAFNGDLLTVGADCSLQDLWLDGQGATYTGRGIVIGASADRFTAHRCTIKDFESYCVEFTTALSGSQSGFYDCEIARYDGTASGKFAVKLPTSSEIAGATPRRFVGCEFNGTKSIDLGGCNNTEIIASYVGRLNYTSDSRAVVITGCRLGVNETAMDLAGANHAISGCAISPAITLISGTSACALAGNDYNNAPVDNSGNGSNFISSRSATYTVSWTGGSSNPAIGNGTLSGEFSRNGDVVSVNIELICGSTTTFGSGEWRFSLPVTPRGDYAQTGTAYMLDSSAVQVNAGVVLLAPLETYVILYSHAATAQVQSTNPWTWANGDIVRISFTYLV